MLSDKSAQVIRDTLPAVGAAIGEITPLFYEKMFTAHPELIRDLFNRGTRHKVTSRSRWPGPSRHTRRCWSRTTLTRPSSYWPGSLTSTHRSASPGSSMRSSTSTCSPPSCRCWVRRSLSRLARLGMSCTGTWLTTSSASSGVCTPTPASSRARCGAGRGCGSAAGVA